jgi:hypothetical protein
MASSRPIWVQRLTPNSGLIGCLALLLLSSTASAHGISETARNAMENGSTLAYIWLGAEHMVTGYDHLLFLFGVLFFLSNFGDIVRFITAFTVGHCVTLLGATLAGVSANPYLIDAVIALSVIYKGFENLGGFEKRLGIKAPNLLTMVFVFGLIHGFGLSTRLQELPLGSEGLVGRILAFNVGVELGQIAALAFMLLFFAGWRTLDSFERFSKAANLALILAGAALFGMQINGYLYGDAHHDHAVAETEHTEHGQDHGAEHGHDHGAKHGAMKDLPDGGAAVDAETHQHGSGEAHSH